MPAEIFTNTPIPPCSVSLHQACTPGHPPAHHVDNMSTLVDSAKLAASVLVSTALQFFSRTIRMRPAIHRVVKVFDRGHAKVSESVQCSGTYIYPVTD